MTIRTKTISAASLLAAPLLAAMFLLQGCATIVGGTSQKIPVTSTPVGARIVVDGKEAGTAPLILKLKRRKPHVIRIEQEGFNPHEIRIMRNRPKAGQILMSLGGNVLLAAPAAGLLTGVLFKDDPEEIEDVGGFFGAFFNAMDAAAFALVAWIGLDAAFTIADVADGSLSSLSPESVEVVLSPAGENGRPDVTEIDEARRRGVKWLRIRAVR
jgi:hypothetical protein